MGWQDAPEVPDWQKAPEVNSSAPQPSGEAPGAIDLMMLPLAGIPNVGGAEAGLNVGSGMVAAPISGVAGILQGIKNYFSPGMSAADRVAQVQDALIYQPRTQGGQDIASVIGLPFQKLAEGADKAGEAVRTFNPQSASMWGLNKNPAPLGSGNNPLAATLVNTGIQMLPALATRKPGAAAGDAAGAAKQATGAAEKYVRSKLNRDWSTLPDEARARLTEIAKDQRTLDALDPKAIERQLQLESLPVPIKNASKGQLTRDPRQLQQEELLKSTDAGKALTQDALDQNRAISANIDFLRNKTGGKPLSDMELGRSLQDQNLRAKQKSMQGKTTALYKQARAAGETKAPADVTPLDNWLKDPANARNAPDINSALKDYANPETGYVSINDLERIRQEATLKSNSPDGATRHYYGEGVKVIDDILDNSGGTAYKKARAAHRAERTEFGDQASVERLVENKTRTDRQTALEDTHDKVVIQGSVESLAQVRDSLLKGGTPATRARGAQAWKDLGATTIENIKEAATKGASNQAGEANSTYVALKRAIDRVGDDKLEILIGKESTAQLRNVLKAAETLKTEPTGINVRGSNTVNKLMNILDKSLVGKIPLIGDTAKGVVKGAQMVKDLGKNDREVRAAQESPMTFAEIQAKKAQKKAGNAGAFKKYSGAATATQENNNAASN